jgi:hypothetical protein
MKIFNIILFMISILTLNLFSQQTNLSVNLNPIPNTTRDYTVEINLVLPITPADGVAIEAPQEISLIPVAISINESQLWLQNLSSIPSQDSVVAWQLVPQGMLMVFKNGLFKSGDEIKLRCISTMQNPDLSQNLFNAKEIISQTDGLRIANESFASGIMPQISNQ